MAQSHRIHPAQARGDYDITDALRHRKNDFGALILRLTIGGLMLFHGLTKLIYGTEQVNQILSRVGLPVFFSIGVLLAEVMAPVMLILGFKTRIAGFLIAVNMFMAALLVHSAEFSKISEMGGWMLELNALYFFGAIAIIFFGSGRYAVTRGHGYLD